MSYFLDLLPSQGRQLIDLARAALDTGLDHLRRHDIDLQQRITRVAQAVQRFI